MRHATILVAILAFTPLANATAQVPVRPGARVRISHDCRTRTLSSGATRIDCRTEKGTLAALTADSVVLRIGEPATPLAVSLASVTRLDLYRGRRSLAGRGALIGLVVLGGFGAIAGFNLCELDETQAGCGLGDHLLGSVYGGALFGLLGIVIGAVTGALIKTDRWEEVPLDRLRVSFVPQRDGRFALGLSVRF